MHVPTDGLAEQLCEHLMQTFFTVWMGSCARCFPTPTMWKTSQIMVARWRHHSPVVEWWSRIISTLTSRLLETMHGPSFPQYNTNHEELKLVQNISNEQIAQTWFRMLHIISDPVELCNSNKFSKSPLFIERSLKSDSFIDPSQHPCLRMLPYIFLKVMKGISSLVDAFLGLSSEKKYEVTYPNILMQISTPITPTNTRKSGKNKKGSSVPPKPPSSPLPPSTNPPTPTTTPSNKVDMHPHPSPLRPHVNTLLHLLGGWLFDAALASCQFEQASAYEGRSRTPSGVLASNLLTAPPSDMVANPMFDGSDFPESSDAGRAESCGALCRLVCCKRTGEEILPAYLARFYLVMSQGLLGDSRQVTASILLNSVNMMRIDLPGVTCLLPALLTTLESILPDRDLQYYKPYVNTTELRRASIHLLISMLPLPLHYNTMEIEEIWPPSVEKLTFQSTRKRLLDLLIGSLQCETDAVNTQMILGALLLTLHDSALFESLGDSANGSPLGVVQPNENEVVPIDTAYGLFVQVVNLVSQKLDPWKSDITVTLSALELLGGLAKARINMPDNHECRRAVHELCSYIVHQCERPPPHHKRELHSMIVSAFHTLSIWLNEHPYLMKNKECLNEVLEIIELGVTGSKSRVAGSVVMKHEKELNPVSMRVLEAAEGLLIIVFEHLGGFPTPCTPSTTCSLLDERTLLSHASGGHDITMSEAVKRFRYFSLHNGALLSLLEDNLGNEQEPVPTVTMVIRGVSGRKVWVGQLRQTPREDDMTPDSYLTQHDRPSPLLDREIPTKPHYRTFPEEVDNIPLVNADVSIPLLSDVPDPQQIIEILNLGKLIETQIQYDEEVTRQVNATPEPMHGCNPLPPTNEFQSARLLLSHMNHLTLGSVKANVDERRGPDLVMLTSSDPCFATDLLSLDTTPSRHHDTVFVFYVKQGQTNRDEILRNVSDPGIPLHPAFGEFLLSLGWVVPVATHPGWNGRGSSGMNSAETTSDPINLNDHPPGVFNGDEYLLYYADCGTEVAFIVPRLPPGGAVEVDGEESRPTMKLSLDLSATASVTSQESPTSPTNPTNPSLPRKKPLTPRPQATPDAPIALVWAETYDCFESFDVNEVVADLSLDGADLKIKDPVVIFIHPMECGLFRLLVKGQNATKGGVAAPLVSGMVVSRRGLGGAVRMTCVNICNRRRLGSDNHVPPHVKRKQAINEISSKYQRRCTQPDFYTSIFTEGIMTSSNNNEMLTAQS
ncbi:ral GTPase-activating protein subunit beta [Ciona intestinalis]